MEEGVAEGGGGGQLPPLVILVSVTESVKLDKTHPPWKCSVGLSPLEVGCRWHGSLPLTSAHN